MTESAAVGRAKDEDRFDDFQKATNIAVTHPVAEPEEDVALSQVCARVHARVQAFLDLGPGGDGSNAERLKAVQEQTRISLKVIEEALEKYRLDELSISYNGGKDCLVLLILYLAALHAYSTGSIPLSSGASTTTATTNHNIPNYDESNATNPTTNHHTASQPQSLPPELESVYILSRDPFAEVDAFVDASARTYRLRMARYNKPMKEAFTTYLRDRPCVRAIFVGTRRTDPHGAQLRHFDPTDRGWPPFMRIHPVIDWQYAQVWMFIRLLEVPYCALYDLGYTSLGGTSDTHPNPALRQRSAGSAGDGEGGGKALMYRPAYELVADDEERLGRDWK